MRECASVMQKEVQRFLLAYCRQSHNASLLHYFTDRAGLQVQSISSAEAGKPCEQAGEARNAIFLPCEIFKTIQTHCSVCQVTKKAF